jgi:hypothetical protein
MQNNCFLLRISDPFSTPPSLKRTGARPRPNPVLEASLNRASQSAIVVVAAKAARPPGEGETFFENSRRAVNLDSNLGAPILIRMGEPREGCGEQLLPRWPHALPQ